MAPRFPKISREEIEKFAEKAVNKNTVKTTKTWMKCLEVVGRKEKSLKNDIVNYEARELDECRTAYGL